MRYLLRLAILLTAAAAVADEARLQSTGRIDTGPVDWLVTDGARLLYGSGSAILAVGREETLLELEHPATDAALSGELLFLDGFAGGLVVVDLGDLTVRREPLALRGRVRLAHLDGHLVVGDHEGLRFFEIHRPPGRLIPLGTLLTEGPVRAVAASGRDVVAAIEGSGLIEVDARDLRSPVPVRRVPWDLEVEALGLGASTVWVLSPGQTHLLPRGRASEPPVAQPEIGGRDIALAGRLVYLADDAGVSMVKDTGGGPQLFNVIVANDFFSPVELTIDVGDTVSWTNASGFHNVFSCTAEQPFCDDVANETFTSGPPALPIWIYDHTFRLEGTNPYLCQSHAAIMPGLVVVESPGTSPPAVADGSVDPPMIVDKLDPSGTRLELSWSTGSCPGAVDHQILYGSAPQLPREIGGAFALSGAECGIGPGSPYTWSVPTALPSDDTRLLWWLIVTTNGAGREGPWGDDSQGNERSGPEVDGASGYCGIATKDPGNGCRP